MNEPVHVIGMGLGPADLTPVHLALIHRAAVLVGGKRHLSYFRDAVAIKKEISSPVYRVLDVIGRIVVNTVLMKILHIAASVDVGAETSLLGRSAYPAVCSSA